jgi:hypothetical protein
MIENDKFAGEMSLKVYDMPFLIVPAANAKALNPDIQFLRDREAFTFLMEQGAVAGVPVQVMDAMADILSNWDPFKAQRWLGDPGKPGPFGQQPVYQVLGELKGMAQQLSEAVKALGVLSQENAKRIDQLQASRRGPV